MTDTTDGDDIGARLDAVGVTADLAPGDQIINAVVLLRVANMDNDAQGETTLVIGADPSCDVIIQSGLLNQAKAVVDAPPVPDEL